MSSSHYTILILRLSKHKNKDKTHNKTKTKNCRFRVGLMNPVGVLDSQTNNNYPHIHHSEDHSPAGLRLLVSCLKRLMSKNIAEN